MALSLGTVPDSLTVHLVEGADFQCTLQLVEAGQSHEWPDGAVVALEFATETPIVWEAELDGSDATFDVDKADILAIPSRTRTRLTYTHGDTDQVWATGMAVRHG